MEQQIKVIGKIERKQNLYGEKCTSKEYGFIFRFRFKGKIRI